MLDTYQDGFFYHPGGAKPADIAGRIASGAVNPRLDDVFAVAIQETKDRKCSNTQRINRLLARMDAINAEIDRLERANAALDDRVEQQHRAVEHYQKTGEIDDDLLTPLCAKQLKQEVRADAEAEFEAVKNDLPAGWDAISHRIDDEFIYVTLRRERSLRAVPPRQRLKERIAKVLDHFRQPTFERHGRAQLWDRLGTLSPIQRGAP